MGVILPEDVAQARAMAGAVGHFRVAHAKDIHMLLLSRAMTGGGLSDGEEWKGQEEGMTFLEFAHELAKQAVVHADALIRALDNRRGSDGQPS